MTPFQTKEAETFYVRFINGRYAICLEAIIVKQYAVNVGDIL